MADVIKFPGTEMEVIEKYPLSRRLDHPDFGDVCKTTFALGVITDFEKTSDDPITVNSRVKVTGDFGESEYIPLFYHPKAQYWDDETADPPALATDFDEELGCHKRAWMSFRCGDEVAVMLKEGIPVAVMSHTDGVPRAGEDVVKLSTQSVVTEWDFEDSEHPDWPSKIGSTWPDVFIRMNKIDFHDEAEKGLDGLDLKLLNEAERHDGPEETVKTGELNVDIDPNAPYGTFHEDIGGEWENPLAYGFWSEDGSAFFTKVAVWTIKVGPVIFAIYGKFRDTYSKSITYYRVAPEPEVYEYHVIQHVHGISRLCIKAGIYKEGMIEKIAASINAYPDWNYLGGLTALNWWPVEVEGMVFQNDLSVLLAYLPFFDVKSFDEVQWFARPHTKAELEAAGMWPAAA